MQFGIDRGFEIGDRNTGFWGRVNPEIGEADRLFRNLLARLEGLGRRMPA